MIRYLKYLFLFALGLCLLTLALANRGTVRLGLLPEELGTFLGWSLSVEMPLFLVVFLGILLGLMIGFVWEWLREHKHRAEASRAKQKASKLEREVVKLRAEKGNPEEEILALLEEPRKAG